MPSLGFLASPNTAVVEENTAQNGKVMKSRLCLGGEVNRRCISYSMNTRGQQQTINNLKPQSIRVSCLYQVGPD
jgi:hypothetical protein